MNPAPSPLPLENPTHKKPTNLNLTTARVSEAQALARSRYDISLSELVDRLLDKELSIKDGRRGLLYRNFTGKIARA